MTEIEAAWVAGVFEGEGCISWTNRNSVRLTVKMTDLDIIQRLLTLTGVGHVHETPGTHKPAWDWRVNYAADVEAVLHLLLPHFGERRRAKALASLERLASCQRRARPSES